MNNWYKFLSEAVEKKSLNEISQQTLEDTKLETYLKRKDSDQLEAIFEGKKRIAIPFESEDTGLSRTDKELINYIKILRDDGWTVDLSEPFGYASKIVTSEYGGKTFQTKRKVKIGPLISAISPEAAEFWTKNNKFYTTKENELYFAKKYMIVISRAPIDILRMSDHDGWTSCHSVGGGYFKCAVQEAVDGGAIAYIVESKELEKVNLEDEEIFKDKQRGIDGVVPLSRFRIRRFISDHYSAELGVPEVRAYGQNFPGFYEKLAQYLMTAQKSVIDSVEEQSDSKSGKPRIDLNNWKLYGGSYEDNPGRTLFQDFFEDEFSFYGDPGKHASDIEYQEMVERVQRMTNDANRRFQYSSVWASVEEYDVDDYYVDYGGTIDIDIEEEVVVPQNWRILGTIAESLAAEYSEIRDEAVEIQKHTGSTGFRFILNTYDSGENDYADFITEVGYLERKYDEVKDTLVHILMQEGYISNEAEAALSDFDQELEHFDINFDREEIHIYLKGQYESTTKAFNIDLRKYSDLLNKSFDAESYRKYFYHFTESIVRGAIDKGLGFSRADNNTETHKLEQQIIQNFVNRLKLDLSPQGSLFEAETPVGKTASRQLKPRGPITDKNLKEDLGIDLRLRPYTNVEFDQQRVRGTIDIVLTCSVKYGKTKDPKSIPVFKKFAKFLDKNYLQILQIIREKLISLIQEKWEELLQLIKEKAPVKNAYEYPSWKQEKLTQTITTPSGAKYQEYIEEKKNKLFKLDGSTWRTIK
jgi:hypothetical protein